MSWPPEKPDAYTARLQHGAMFEDERWYVYGPTCVVARPAPGAPLAYHMPREIAERLAKMLSEAYRAGERAKEHQIRIALGCDR